MRRVSHWTAIPIAVLVAACADGAGDRLTAPPAPSLSYAGPAPACDGARIRATLATIHTEGQSKAFAIPTFNAAQQQGTSPAAVRAYWSIIADLAARYQADELREPARFNSVQDGVFYLMSSLAHCAGSTLPPDLYDVLDALGDGNGETRICTGFPDQPLTCENEVETAVIIVPPGFLVAPALFIIEPAARPHPPFVQFGTQRSSTWRLRVEPIDAQVNYPVTTSAVTATVGLCVDLEHGHPLFVFQENEEDGSIEQLERDDLLVAAELDCPMGDAALPLRVRMRGAGAGAWLADGARALLRGAGALFGPRPLYAFDGGIGGKTFALRSLFAAVETVEEEPTTLSFFKTPEGTPVGTKIHLASGHSKSLVVSTSPTSVVVPEANCDITSDQYYVADVTQTDNGFFTVHAYDYGTADITAICGELEGTLTVVVED